MKQYADRTRKASDRDVVVGQQVIVTNNAPHRNKYTPPYDIIPGTVTKIKGNSIFITHRRKEIMRPSSQVQPY